MTKISDLRTLTLAFYNIENLFDTEDDVYTNDDDFLPQSAKRWTPKRYQNKLHKLGLVISQIGSEHSIIPPSIIGLAEVENQTVIEDLLSGSSLKSIPYGYVHFDSMDERGIDVALLYHKEHFQLTSSETFNVFLQDEEGQRDYTRDILLVEGVLAGTKVYIFVNHWSSRREGELETEYKRMAAANVVLETINRVKLEDSEAHIIVMGDFNDNPNDKSVTTLAKEAALMNPFKAVWSDTKGSLNHDFEWNLFDQILCSYNFLSTNPGGLRFAHADVFNEKFVSQYHGKYKGQPFRTYVGKRYMGGYSDHFPVYIELTLESEK